MKRRTKVNMSKTLEKTKYFLSKYILHINQRAFYFMFLSWLKHLFRAEVVHIKIHNRKLDRPVIIVSNHLSGWDPFLILSAMPRRMFFNNLLWRIPAHHTFFKGLKFIHYRPLFSFLGVYPIGGQGDLMRSLEGTINLLKNGQSTVFFPEAKRIAQGEESKPKPGISHIIKHTKTYILPVNLSYSRRGKNGLGARPGKSKLIFGDLIKSEYFLEQYADDVRHEEVMRHVRFLSETTRQTTITSIKSEKQKIPA